MNSYNLGFDGDLLVTSDLPQVSNGETEAMAPKFTLDKERELHSVNKLHIFIHPLGLAMEATEDRKEFAEKVTKEITLGENDLIWFMPMTDTSSLEKSKEFISGLRNMPGIDENSKNWVWLFKEFRNKFGKNRVMMIPESVLSGSTDIKTQDSLERTGNRGFEIDNNTQVVVGGGVWSGV